MPNPSRALVPFQTISCQLIRMASNRRAELFRRHLTQYNRPKAKLHIHLSVSSQTSHNELLWSDSHNAPFRLLLSQHSSACLKQPHLGVTAEVTVMLSRTKSSGQLG